ncbi:MAG TPA: hypothetical protein VL475_08720 [Planctomycetaceae bacterium]|nr:hypothetical protein [Planctomycetaceae bacterium]
MSTAALLATFWLGWQIGDATSRELATQGRVGVHFLTAVGALCFALLVHALVLTYFMGTGRWLEETCQAYRLGDEWQSRSRNLKWRMYPAMVLSLVLLIGTGALGGAADPASALGFQGIGGLTAAQLHLAVAAATLAFNAFVNVYEFLSLRRNGLLVNEVLGEVRRIRLERGLPV